MTVGRMHESSRADAARVVGIAAVAVIGLFTVHMPDGYLGSADQSTPVSHALTILFATTAVIGAIAHIRGWRWAFLVEPLLACVTIGTFIPALTTDPVMAGFVVAWGLHHLARRMVLPPRTSAPSISPPEDPVERWMALNTIATRHLIGVSLLATTVVAGYGIGSRLQAFLTCLALDALVFAMAARFLRLLIAQRDGAAILILVSVAAAVLLAARPGASLALLGVAQLVLLSALLVRTPLVAELVEVFLARPAILVLVSFLILIGGGTLLLSFPAAAADGHPIGAVTALFTATSAACVTGLIVVDTGSAFSTFGQVVILVLIQAGGLSIMVLSTFAALLLGQRLGLRGETALGEMLDQQTTVQAYRLVRFIVASTLAIEALGAAALGWSARLSGLEFGRSVWWGVFHSISAFCNAGFALQADSLVSHVSDPIALLVVALLITLGGLGFPVLLALVQRVAGRPVRHAGLQVRLVLWSSLALTGIGTLWYLAAEAHRTLEGLGAVDRVVNALFQSVTLRTAGFNSVDFATMSAGTILLMMVLMFIGASPGGTGGGIKTTTAVVLLAAVPSILRREQRVVLGGRTLPLETVFRSAAIAVVAMLFLLGGLLVLTTSQPLPFDHLMFEAISAFGTVGLSLGATPALDTLGRLVIVILMLVGRVGPLTLALVLGRGRPNRVQYPETRIMVG